MSVELGAGTFAVLKHFVWIPFVAFLWKRLEKKVEKIDTTPTRDEVNGIIDQKVSLYDNKLRGDIRPIENQQSVLTTLLQKYDKELDDVKDDVKDMEHRFQRSLQEAVLRNDEKLAAISNELNNHQLENQRILSKLEQGLAVNTQILEMLKKDKDNNDA